MASFYGLRREEIVGLKWSAIHFEEKTITIKHTERSFYRDLRLTFGDLEWKYIGVWRRGGKGERLYFYTAIMVNEGGMVGVNLKIKEGQAKKRRKEYILKTHILASNLVARW